MSEYRNANNGVMNINGSMSNVVGGTGNSLTERAVDLTVAPLVTELERLLQAVEQAGPEHAADVAAVREATEAASTGDKAKLRTALARASSWVLTMASAIGVSLVAKELSELV